MKVQQFLEYHGMARNPFAEEDASTDPVFKDHCIDSTYHPAWDKVYGDPAEPATSLVFGEKGSGKTAMRLQIARHLKRHNASHPENRLFIVHYDDFNPFLDRFRQHVGGRRRPDKVLEQWKLWDHMDALLALSVTGLVDRVLESSHPSKAVEAEVSQAAVDRLDRHQCRDLLLLSACYDASTAETFRGRWNRLRKRLRYPVWRSFLDFAFGAVWSTCVVALILALIWQDRTAWLKPGWVSAFLLLGAAGWLPRLWRMGRVWMQSHAVLKRSRVTNREAGPLRQTLMRFSNADLTGQPLPNKESTDDRYEMLTKLQAILETMGYRGIIVLVDRVDEPHLINGAAERMKLLLWPMLDNKFLKHPGMGLKMMLPIELTRYIEREDRSFYQRSRLDKQNVIPSFEWTGEALYDVANARIAACVKGDRATTLRDLLVETFSSQRLLESLRSLRVPRHLFKFLYRLLVTHCNSHIDAAPVWRIPAETFESTLAVYLRDQDAFDRGVGAGS